RREQSACSALAPPQPLRALQQHLCVLRSRGLEEIEPPNLFEPAAQFVQFDSEGLRSFLPVSFQEDGNLSNQLLVVLRPRPVEQAHYFLMAKSFDFSDAYQGGFASAVAHLLGKP